ncbi:DUF1523 family protein, partial [Pasteurella multocida]|uniref:DUF1523 family protein n=1 Tax=Pasteurella multocida TaxID=747 RepID=UPI0014613760
GWRLVMFDEFRFALNITSVVEHASPSHPFFAYILYFILLITLFFSVQFIRGWFDSVN